MEEESGHGAVFWVGAEDGEVGVWVEAVDEACSRRGGDFDAERAGGDAAIGGAGDVGAEAPDVGPPRVFGRGVQGGAAFFVGGLPGAQRGHGEFAVALVGGAMAAEVGEEEGGGGEERGDAVLPVLMAAFDLGDCSSGIDIQAVRAKVRA